MRHSSFTWAPLFWSVAVFVGGGRALFAEAPPEATPRFVVIDLGPQMASPVKISDANIVLGHGWHAAWFSWSDGTLTPLRREDIPPAPASALHLKLPQMPGAAVVPLKKVESAPSLRVRKGATAAEGSTTQVIGNGPGGAYLWEKEHGAGKNFGAPIPLNLLVPQDNVGVPWNITSVADINSGGAMVGNAIYTRTSPSDPITAGPHGVLILPMAIVREDTPGSGNFNPIGDDGLDNNCVLPIYITENRQNQPEPETDKTDDFSANIYGGLHGPVRATMIYTLKTRLDKSDTGTLSETAAASDIFENQATHVRLEIQPLEQAPADDGTLKVLVNDPQLNINGDSHLLRQTAPTSSKYEDSPFPLEVILKAPLSTSAINTFEMDLGGESGAPNEVLTETAVNSRIFKSPEGLSIAITAYQATPGGTMTVRLFDVSLDKTRVQFTLSETSPTSLQYSNYVRVIAPPAAPSPISTPATDGQAIFYIEMSGTLPTKVTVTSGPSHATVEAVPVKGYPNLLRTGKLVMIQQGDPFRAPGITTIEAAGEEIDLQMEGQTIVK